MSKTIPMSLFVVGVFFLMAGLSGSGPAELTWLWIGIVFLIATLVFSSYLAWRDRSKPDSANKH